MRALSIVLDSLYTHWIILYYTHTREIDIVCRPATKLVSTVFTVKRLFLWD